jgi:hypothetical protein
MINKYIKYKKKYLSLKLQYGDGPSDTSINNPLLQCTEQLGTSIQLVAKLKSDII